MNSEEKNPASSDHGDPAGNTNARRLWNSLFDWIFEYKVTSLTVLMLLLGLYFFIFGGPKVSAAAQVLLGAVATTIAFFVIKELHLIEGSIARSVESGGLGVVVKNEVTKVVKESLASAESKKLIVDSLNDERAVERLCLASLASIVKADFRGVEPRYQLDTQIADSVTNSILRVKRGEERMRHNSYQINNFRTVNMKSIKDSGGMIECTTSVEYENICFRMRKGEYAPMYINWKNDKSARFVSMKMKIGDEDCLGMKDGKVVSFNESLCVVKDDGTEGRVAVHILFPMGRCKVKREWTMQRALSYDPSTYVSCTHFTKNYRLTLVYDPADFIMSFMRIGESSEFVPTEDIPADMHSHDYSLKIKSDGGEAIRSWQHDGILNPGDGCVYSFAHASGSDVA